LDLLSHIQVSLDATYISPVQPESQDSPRTALLSAPPRTASMKGAKPRTITSILPPSTPNPTPSTKDDDHRYVKSEGTLLLASIWGQNQSGDSLEAFSLIWSEKSRVWFAVYRFAVAVCKQ
jgi:hypothetical protein